MFGSYAKNIKQWATAGKKVYFVSEKNFSFSDIKKFPGDHEYFQVPYIPHDSEGNTDTARLEAMKSPGSSILGKIEDIGVPVKIHTVSEPMKYGITIPRYVSGTKEKTKIREDRGVSLLDGGELLIRKPDDTLDQLIKKCKNRKTGIIYYDTAEPLEESCADMYRHACEKAGALRKAGLKTGSMLIFLFASNKEFIETYWACVMLGVTVVPLETAQDYSAECAATAKIINIWKMLDEPYIITDHESVSGLSVLIGRNPEIIDSTALESCEYTEDFHSWTDDEPALILFTSGSTGLPKGVVLTQKNIFGRTLGEVQRYGMDNTEVDFNWMTLTHAAGLIWSHIRDIYLDILQIQARTDVILAKPSRFIDIMNRYRATVTWAPNFAFALLAGAAESGSENSWDLSCVKYMFAGGEANISRTLRHFLEVFSVYGLHDNVIRPAFGMTETSSCITYNDSFRLSSSSDDDKNISIGAPMPGIKVRIMSGDGTVLPEGETGYIQCSGNTVTGGYYHNEEANRNSFTDDGYLITGDLGFIENGYIYITGREKDVIIINGLNYFVQDIEAAADSTEGVLNSYSVAVSVPDGNGKENIVIFFVPEDESLLEMKVADSRLSELADRIKITVRKSTGLSPDVIVPVSESYNARTDIGKKQRNVYKNDYLAGKFDENIAKISDKRKQTVLSKRWIRDNGTEYRKDVYMTDGQAEGFLTCSDISELPDGAVAADKFFLDASYDISDPDVLRDVFSRSLEHLRKYTSVKKDLTVIFPLEKGFPDMLGCEYNPVYSFLYGVLKTISLENEHFAFRLVDTDEYSDSLLLKESVLAPGRDCVIYRRGLRYGYEYVPVSYAEERKTDICGKLAVIAGGAGGTGKYIAGYFVNEYSAKVLLIGQAERSENISDDIMYIKADVTDADAVKSAVRRAEEFFSTETGIILDLAGKMSGIPQDVFFGEPEKHTVSAESTDNMFAAASVKYYGTRSLCQACSSAGVPLLVFGSLTADFGGRYMCAYSGANTMQEIYCRSLIDRGEDVRLICWSMWKDTGMSRGAGSGASLGGFCELETAEAVEIFHTLFTKNTDAAYVGLSVSSDRMKHLIGNYYRVYASVETGSAEDRETVLKASASGELSEYDIVCRVNEAAFLKDSENSELINKVLNIWKKTLSADEIDISANIFDAGGNSLTIYVLADNISKELGEEISASDIMTYPNIREFASYLCLRGRKTADSENQDERIEQMKNARKRIRSERRADS